MRATRGKIRAKRGGRALLAGGTIVGLAGWGGGAGALARFVGNMAGGSGDPAKGIGFVRDNWWGEPALIFAAAVFSRTMGRGTGGALSAWALAGAAGYSGMFRYELNNFQLGKGSNPVPQFKHATGAGGGAAGALQRPGEAGALFDAGAPASVTFA